VFSAADPASFAPLVSLGRAGARPKAILSYVTAGDAIAPVTTGIALARALGLVPFLRPGSDTTYPAHAEFVTPPELFSQLANETPDRLLIETHVLEGIARLKRHPPTESCGRNEVPVSNDDFFCHAPCAADDTSSCLPEQHCVSGRCEAIPVDAAQCADFLFDVDALSEGASGLNQRQSPLPLRLARVAAHELDPVKIWQPSLRAQPFSDDAVAWPATEPLLAHVHAYIDPLGSHGLGAPEPCAQFPHNLYMARLVARFFATRGHDIYYLSHPSTHHCLVGSADDQVCAFLTP
jgi:hypothetical protein